MNFAQTTLAHQDVHLTFDAEAGVLYGTSTLHLIREAEEVVYVPLQYHGSVESVHMAGKASIEDMNISKCRWNAAAYSVQKHTNRHAKGDSAHTDPVKLENTQKWLDVQSDLVLAVPSSLRHARKLLIKISFATKLQHAPHLKYYAKSDVLLITSRHGYARQWLPCIDDSYSTPSWRILTEPLNETPRSEYFDFREVLSGPAVGSSGMASEVIAILGPELHKQKRRKQGNEKKHSLLLTYKGNNVFVIDDLERTLHPEGVMDVVKNCIDICMRAFEIRDEDGFVTIAFVSGVHHPLGTTTGNSTVLLPTTWLCSETDPLSHPQKFYELTKAVLGTCLGQGGGRYSFLRPATLYDTWLSAGMRGALAWNAMLSFYGSNNTCLWLNQFASTTRNALDRTPVVLNPVAASRGMNLEESCLHSKVHESKAILCFLQLVASLCKIVKTDKMDAGCWLQGVLKVVRAISCIYPQKNGESTTGRATPSRSTPGPGRTADNIFYKTFFFETAKVFAFLADHYKVKHLAYFYDLWVASDARIRLQMCSDYDATTMSLKIASKISVSGAPPIGDIDITTAVCVWEGDTSEPSSVAEAVAATATLLETATLRINPDTQSILTERHYAHECGAVPLHVFPLGSFVNAAEVLLLGQTPVLYTRPDPHQANLLIDVEVVQPVYCRVLQYLIDLSPISRLCALSGVLTYLQANPMHFVNEAALRFVGSIFEDALQEHVVVREKAMEVLAAARSEVHLALLQTVEVGPTSQQSIETSLLVLRAFTLTVSSVVVKGKNGRHDTIDRIYFKRLLLFFNTYTPRRLFSSGAVSLKILFKLLELLESIVLSNFTALLEDDRQTPNAVDVLFWIWSLFGTELHSLDASEDAEEWQRALSSTTNLLHTRSNLFAEEKAVITTILTTLTEKYLWLHQACLEHARKPISGLGAFFCSRQSLLERAGGREHCQKGVTSVPHFFLGVSPAELLQYCRREETVFGAAVIRSYLAVKRMGSSGPAQEVAGLLCSPRPSGSLEGFLFSHGGIPAAIPLSSIVQSLTTGQVSFDVGSFGGRLISTGNFFEGSVYLSNFVTMGGVPKRKPLSALSEFFCQRPPKALQFLINTSNDRGVQAVLLRYYCAAWMGEAARQSPKKMPKFAPCTPQQTEEQCHQICMRRARELIAKRQGIAPDQVVLGSFSMPPSERSQQVLGGFCGASFAQPPQPQPPQPKAEKELPVLLKPKKTVKKAVIPLLKVKLFDAGQAVCHLLIELNSDAADVYTSLHMLLNDSIPSAASSDVFHQEGFCFWYLGRTLKELRAKASGTQNTAAKVTRSIKKNGVSWWVESLADGVEKPAFVVSYNATKTLVPCRPIGKIIWSTDTDERASWPRTSATQLSRCKRITFQDDVTHHHIDLVPTRLAQLLYKVLPDYRSAPVSHRMEGKVLFLTLLTSQKKPYSVPENHCKGVGSAVKVGQIGVNEVVLFTGENAERLSKDVTLAINFGKTEDTLPVQGEVVGRILGSTSVGAVSSIGRRLLTVTVEGAVVCIDLAYNATADDVYAGLPLRLSGAMTAASIAVTSELPLSSGPVSKLPAPPGSLYFSSTGILHFAFAASEVEGTLVGLATSCRRASEEGWEAGLNVGTLITEAISVSNVQLSLEVW